MGLDITAYEKVTFICGERDDEDMDDRDDVERLYKDHPSRTQNDDLEPGYYSTEGERHGFRAGSYSGYNWWRSNLAKMTGTTDKEIWKRTDISGPFVPLIYFSDCEGFIGPKTSAKLAADFDEWRERAGAFAGTFEDEGEGKYWARAYENWSKAFHIAAKGGAVKFH